MPLLLFGPVTPPKVITAGTVVLSLVPVGASMATQRVIVAGTIVLRLLPETSNVTLPGAVAPAETPPTSAEVYAAALLTSHQVRARVTTSVASYTGAILSGSVDYDRRREVRAMASLVLVDITAPTAAGDEWAPGSSVVIDRGVVVPGGTIWHTLGTFEVEDSEASLGGTVGISANDPSAALAQPIGDVLVIPAGTSAGDILRLLWEPVLGTATSEWSIDGAGMALTGTRTFSEDDERLHTAVAVMADMGLEVYMGRSGYPVLAPMVDPNTLPVSRTYRQGAGEALATDIKRRTGVEPYNRVIVIGEPPDAPAVRAVADITDLTNPYHANRIGLRVAPVHRSAQITTQHQAMTVARAKLVELVTWTDSLIWVGVPDPTLEVGQVIAVADTTTRTDARYRIDTLSLPVTTGAMSIGASRLVPVFA